MEVFHMRVDRLSPLFENSRTDKVSGTIPVLRTSTSEMEALPLDKRIDLHKKYLIYDGGYDYANDQAPQGEQGEQEFRYVGNGIYSDYSDYSDWDEGED